MERKYYRMNIAGVERDLPLCPISDELQIGAFVIFGDPELTTACAQALLDKAPEYDYMISAEAKGIPLVHEMARLAGNQRYFLARKSPKLYMTGVFESTVRSITTAKEQTLYLDKADAEIMNGKKILLMSRKSCHLVNKRYSLCLCGYHIIILGCFFKKCLCTRGCKLGISENYKCAYLKLIADRAKGQLSLHARNIHSVGFAFHTDLQK